jgi:DNA polymerase-1
VAGQPTSPAGPLTGKTVFGVDAHSLIYQVFHALPEMSGPAGQPVGAVHGFVRDLLDLIEVHKAEYMVVAFDALAPTFREAIDEQYKGTREAMPADLQLQMPVIRQFVEALGLLAVAVDGFEADDVLATLARQVVEAGGRCMLVTNDKDCRQLLSERVQILNLRKRQLFDAASLQAEWGIAPEQVIDFQALVGDPTDNIPGVPLIGPKTAQELLARYGTLEAILEHAEEIASARRRENLLAYREQALRSRELARLRTDVPITIDWEQARVGRFQPQRLAQLCRECGFRQLERRIDQLIRKFQAAAAREEALPAGEPAGFSTAEARPSLGHTAQGQALLPEAGAGEAAVGQAADGHEESAAALATMGLGTLRSVADPSWGAQYRALTSLEELDELIRSLADRSQLAIDTETTSVHPRQAELVGLSLAWEAGQAVYIPVRCPPGEPQLPLEDVMARLRPLLEDERVAKIGQNLKYDLIVLRGQGVHVRGMAMDTMVADYLLEPGERSHTLDDLARRYLRYQPIAIQQLLGEGKAQRRMDEVPLAQVATYAAEDADVAWRLAEVLAPRLAAQGLTRLLTELEVPLIEVLAEMEYHGIRVDVARLRELSVQFQEKIETLRAEIFALAGREFNLDSRLQLSELLFSQLQLPVVKRTKTGPSTDAEVLEALALLHPLPAKILEYRHLAKLKSTYVDALPALVLPQTGRIHTSFKQDVAATGRLSSQDPNLQNIPIRTPQGRAIRSAFLPAEGWRLLAADYSQIELRVLAHFSQDAALLAAFAEDRDIHAQVASEVYGVPLAEVTPQMRRSAKAVNFGVIYGQSAFGLARSLGIDQQDAALFIDRYFAGYPGVEAFLRQTLEEARRQGYVSTILGRRRPVQGVRDPATVATPHQRNLPERIAINTVIQGSAADIIKRAMLGVHRRLRQERLQARLLLQIHDELIFEFPPEEEATLRTLVVEEMSSAVPLRVPLKVDIHTGANWAECEDG